MEKFYMTFRNDELVGTYCTNMGDEKEVFVVKPEGRGYYKT
jgi:hypothetical protein